MFAKSLESSQFWIVKVKQFTIPRQRGGILFWICNDLNSDGKWNFRRMSCSWASWLPLSVATMSSFFRFPWLLRIKTRKEFQIKWKFKPVIIQRSDIIEAPQTPGPWRVIVVIRAIKGYSFSCASCPPKIRPPTPEDSSFLMLLHQIPRRGSRVF